MSHHNIIGNLMNNNANIACGSFSHFSLYTASKFVCYLTAHQHYLRQVPRIVEIEHMRHVKNEL